MENKAIIRVKNLVARYDEELILDNITLDILTFEKIISFCVVRAVKK